MKKDRDGMAKQDGEKAWRGKVGRCEWEWKWEWEWE
jgi:hypothetical protein